MLDGRGRTVTDAFKCLVARWLFQSSQPANQSYTPSRPRGRALIYSCFVCLCACAVASTVKQNVPPSVANQNGSGSTTRIKR